MPVHGHTERENMNLDYKSTAKSYIKTPAIALVALLALAACGTPTMQIDYLPASPAGKNRYAVNGIVMVKKFEKGVTKPYIDKMMQGVCLNGYRYNSLQESLNKELGVSVWVQWEAVLECK